MPKIDFKKGNKPYLIVAPHGGGPTDIRSALQADFISDYLGSYAIINKGWVRPWTGTQEGDASKSINTSLDIKNGIANLNDLNHCRQSPLNKDFLKPLEDYKNHIISTYKHVYIYLIHGMDDTIRSYGAVDVVIGYGAGDPPRHSCPLTFRDRFASCLEMESFTPASGKAGGRLSAWNNTNLNQLFSNDDKVTSIQIEIALSIRDNDISATESAFRLAKAIERMHDKAHVPFMKKIPER